MGPAIVRTVLLVCLFVWIVESNPRPQQQRRRTSSSFNDEPALSASSYSSLGIQPSARSARGESSKYWWQGPQSPFREGASTGNSANAVDPPRAHSRPKTVIGCSGDGCGSSFNPHGAAASSSASSFSSSSSGGTCCNHYWQKPENPCFTHQGPDCPSGYSCVNYLSCSNGFISSSSSGFSSRRPSTDELMSYGRPCGNSGTDVCCKQAPPPTQPVVQSPPSHNYYPAPAPQPVYSPPPPTQAPAYHPPPTQAAVYQPPPTPAPVYHPPATQAPAYYPPPTAAPVVQQPVYQPPAPQPQPVVAAPTGPPAPLLPYPGCAAALKCVPEEYCNMEGVMVNTPVFLTPQQKEYRTPLMACLNTETNQVGYCCRDPLYEDPWPADMPMPGMAKPPVAPVVVQPPAISPPAYKPPPTQAPAYHPPATQAPVYYPPPTTRPPPPPTTRPPPPPTAAPVVVQPPVNTYLPPPPPPPPTPVVVEPPVATYLPPPPPPVTQPVVPPSTDYLPPPVVQPVVAPPPTIEYIPPPAAPAPVPAAQVAQKPQCGASRAAAQQLNNGEAALGEFPWHAMIAQQNGSMSCSGALIGSKFVATAFHCVRGINPSSLRVRLGEQLVGATSEPLPHYEIPVTAVVGHPEFAEGSLFNDVAILMLSTPAPSGVAHISPVCLPVQAEQVPTQCVVTGWGHDTLSGLQSGMLNKVQVGIVRNPECQTSLQATHLGKYFKLHQNFMCASTANAINPCKVDGGSPMTCQRPDGSYVLAGLSSWSVGCSNQLQPGVYADVPAVAAWLQQQMNQPEANLIDTSNASFHSQQQFQQNFGPSAGYGR